MVKQFYLTYKVKLATIVEDDSKAPFSIATTPRCREGCYSFPGQRGPESNSNERVLYTPQISRTGASPSDSLVSYPGHLLGGEFLPFCRDTVDVFFSPS